MEKLLVWIVVAADLGIIRVKVFAEQKDADKFAKSLKGYSKVEVLQEEVE